MKKLLLVVTAVFILVLGAASCAPAAVTELGGSAPTQPSGAIAWNEAINHVGERATVCGLVAGTHWASSSNGKPTFLNVGKDYPDSNRFTVVIWIQSRDNFPQAPEVYYLGKTICVTGLITEYEGIAQIEAKDPSQIQEQ